MKELSPELKDAVTQNRMDILRFIPFMGIYFVNLDIAEFDENDIEEGMKTAAMCVSPKPMIGINKDFWLGLTRKEQNFVFVHEVLHSFFEHHGRARAHNYHRELWNVATDYVINWYISDMMENSGNKSNHILERPEIALYDSRFAGMTADRVYYILLEENDNDAGKAAEAHGGMGIPGSGKGPLDKVSADALSEKDKQSMDQAFAAGFSMDGSTDMGEESAELIKKIQELLNPKISWKDVLAEYVTKAARNRRTYNRVSRRSTGAIIFPSTTGDAVSVVFGVDSSGSMSNKDLKEAATELKAVCESFESWELEYLTCDTKAHYLGYFSTEEGEDFEDIKVEFVGGGGTDMAPMLEYANDSEHEPSVCIIVTDGYIPEDTLNNAYDDLPCIVLVTSSGNRDLKLRPEIQVIVMEDE